MSFHVSTVRTIFRMWPVAFFIRCVLYWPNFFWIRQPYVYSEIEHSHWYSYGRCLRGYLYLQIRSRHNRLTAAQTCVVAFHRWYIRCVDTWWHKTFALCCAPELCQTEYWSSHFSIRQRRSTFFTFVSFQIKQDYYLLISMWRVLTLISFFIPIPATKIILRTAQPTLKYFGSNVLRWIQQK